MGYGDDFPIHCLSKNVCPKAIHSGVRYVRDYRVKNETTENKVKNEIDNRIENETTEKRVKTETT